MARPERLGADGAGDAKGFTGYLLKAGKPMLLTLADMEELIRRGEVIFSAGRRSIGWVLPSARTGGSSGRSCFRATARTCTTPSRTKSS